jgi:hypothetical protein
MRVEKPLGDPLSCTPWKFMGTEDSLMKRRETLKEMGSSLMPT